MITKKMMKKFNNLWKRMPKDFTEEQRNAYIEKAAPLFRLKKSELQQLVTGVRYDKPQDKWFKILDT